MKCFRRYAVTALLCVSITAVAAGIAAADESAKRISLGRVQEVVVWGENAKITDPADVTDVEKLLKNFKGNVKIADRIKQYMTKGSAGH